MTLKERYARCKFGGSMTLQERITEAPGYDRMGIEILYKADTNEVEVCGWYDGSVGIAAETVSLKDFLDRVGIPRVAVLKVFDTDGGV